MNGHILVGDVLEKFKDIPDESIDVVITSPPYWGLRNYGVEGQMGLEQDFNEYLDKLDLIMDECYRVLKSTGTCWINLGDTYSTVSGGMKDISKGGTKKYGKIDYGVGHAHTGDDNNERASAYSVDQSKLYGNLKHKSRVGIPERFYIRCIDKGWVARNHIPWIKANSMPSSVRDRFTNKWESIFFFAKKPKGYYFDLDAVRVPPKTGYGLIKSKSRGKRKSLEVLKQQESMSDFGFANKHNYGLHERRERGEAVSNCHPKGKNPGDVFRDKYGGIETETKYRQGMNKERGNNLIEKRHLPPQKEFVDKLRESFTVDEIVQYGIKRTKVEHWFRYDDSGFAYPDVEDWRKVNTKLFPELLQVYFVTDDIDPNKRAVYDKSKPYAVVEREGVIYYRNLPPLNELIDYLTEARKKIGMSIDELENIFGNWTPHHWFDRGYGSYPTKEDWVKVKEILKFDDKYDGVMTTEYIKDAEKINNPKGKNPGDVFEINTRPCKEAHFATFPPTLPEKILKCSCPKGGVVLDPFFGAGTVGLVAEQLDLNWIGIEINPEYVEIAKKRIGSQVKITKHL
jgi:site-specific DNA-methyltransferase (adenine-specific)